MSSRTQYNQVRRVFALFRVLSRSSAPKSIDEIIRLLPDYGVEPDDKGLSKRNIQRDIKFIKEELGYNISVFSGEGYVMESKGHNQDPLLPLFFEPEEIQALCMGRELFDPFKDTHMEKAIESMYQKVTKVYTGKSDISKSIIEMEDAFLIQPRKQRRYKFHKTVIKNLTMAILQKKVVEIGFAKQKDREIKFGVKPHKLIIYDNSIYLLAINENPEYKGFRLYLIPRINTAEITSRSFKPRKIDEVEQQMKDAWGMYLEGPVKNITISFIPEMAGYLAERVWHPSQDFNLTKTSVDMNLHIIMNNEIVNWILGFGNKVIDIKPASLKKMVEEARI